MIKSTLLWIADAASKRVSYGVAFLIIVTATVVVAVNAIPIKATPDGILYVASAKALFKGEFSTYYALFREPGYPFLLTVLHLFGSSGLLVIAVQATFLGSSAFIALYCVRKILRQDHVTVFQVVLTVLLTLNPMFLIYSALVLQQALFTLQLALSVLGIFWALHRPAWLPRPVLLVLIIVNYFVEIWTSIGWLYLGLVPVTAAVALVLWPSLPAKLREAASWIRKVLRAVLIAVGMLVLFALVYLAGSQVYAGWQAVKAPVAHSSPRLDAVIQPLDSVPRIPTVQEMTARMFALMHMGTIDPYVHENDLFLTDLAIPDLWAAQWDTAYQDEPYSSYAVGFISISNPSPIFHYLFAKVSIWASPLYNAAFLGFLLAYFLSAVRRRWTLLLLLSMPLAFLAVYAASNSPIDRYGIPTYPWAVAGFGVLLTWLGQFLAKTRMAEMLHSAIRGERDKQN